MNRSIRVIYLISAFQMGGAEEVACNLAIALKSRGQETLVVAVGRPASRDPVGEDQKERLTTGGVAWNELGGRNKLFNQLEVPWKLLRLVKSWEPDLVHSHTDIPDAVVSFAGRINRLQTARTIHNTVIWPTRTWLGRIVETGLHDKLVVAVSDDAREAYEKLRSRYSLPLCPHVVVIHNGVGSGRLDNVSTPAEMRKELALDDRKKNICFAGRLDRQKGLDVLIEALAGVSPQTLKRIEVRVYGEGPEGSAYRREVSARDLPVSFHGLEPNVARWFPAFDAVVMPSRFEGLGLVAVEALIAGVPVIASDARGLREALPPGWPLIVPVGEPLPLGLILTDLANGRLVMDSVMDEASSWAWSRYGPHRWVSAYEQAYSDCLG